MCAFVKVNRQPHMSNNWVEGDEFCSGIAERGGGWMGIGGGWIKSVTYVIICNNSTYKCEEGKNILSGGVLNQIGIICAGN